MMMAADCHVTEVPCGEIAFHLFVGFSFVQPPVAMNRDS